MAVSAKLRYTVSIPEQASSNPLFSEFHEYIFAAVPVMKQAAYRFTVSTRGKGLVNISREIESWVAKQNMRTAILTVFIRHTSASLVVQENADPDVLTDLNDFFSRLVPEGDPAYRHHAEGPDDMPAHIRAALTQTQISVPVIDGEMALGTWQDIYIFEHRARPHRREVVLHLLGE